MGMTTRSAGEPSAELLSWDSEFWGVRIGRAPTLMDDWALENTIGCMWMLIPAHDQGEIHWSEARGARVMDVRVTLRRGTTAEAAVSRPAEPGDTEGLVAIARTAFRGLTRFYADPRFPDELCDDLYENWIRQSLDGWAAETLVVGDGAGAAGFITVHTDGPTSWIGLVAVADRVKKKGVGTNLVRAAVNWAWEQQIPEMSVVTQGCNIPAQRAFQRAGFLTSQTDIWLHKWFYDA